MSHNVGGGFDPFDLSNSMLDANPRKEFQAASSNTTNWNSDGSTPEDKPIEALIDFQESPSFGVSDPVIDWNRPAPSVNNEYDPDLDESDEPESGGGIKKAIVLISIVLGSLIALSLILIFLVRPAFAPIDQPKEPKAEPKPTSVYKVMSGFDGAPQWEVAFKNPLINGVPSSDGGMVAAVAKGSVQIIETSKGKITDTIKDTTGVVNPINVGTHPSLAVQREGGWTVVTPSQIIQIDGDAEFSTNQIHGVQNSEQPWILNSSGTLTNVVQPAPGAVLIGADENAATWGSANALITANADGAPTSSIPLEAPGPGFQAQVWHGLLNGNLIIVEWRDSLGNKVLAIHEIELGKIMSQQKLKADVQSVHLNQSNTMAMVDESTVISDQGLLYPLSKDSQFISSFGDTILVKSGKKQLLLNMGQQTPSLSPLKPSDIEVTPIGLAAESQLLGFWDGGVGMFAQIKLDPQEDAEKAKR